MSFPYRIIPSVKSHLFILFLSVAITAISFTGSIAQQVEQSEANLEYWIHAGPSISTLGLGVHGGLVFDYNHHLFSLRATSTDSDLGAETWDVAFIYGRSMRYKSLYLAAGTGISVLGGVGYSDLFGNNNKSSIETSIGFPLEGQITWEPVRFLALGIYSFANVNTEQPFGGIGFSVRLGRL